MTKPAKVLIGFFLLVSGFLVFENPAIAQEFSAQKAYQDYQYQLSSYLQANTEYEDAKTFYQNNSTLQLREEARKKTLALLKSRDQLMVVYLTALRIQIVESTGFTTDEKGSVYSQIDPEILWYQEHITNYQDGDDLSTLFTKSDESKTRYQSTTRPIIYNSLFDITLSQQIGMRIDNQSVYTGLKNFINDQVSLGKLKIDPFNRWLSDIDTVLSFLNQNETEAKTHIPIFYTRSYSLNQTYTTGIQILTNSVKPITQLNNYLIEMLTYLESQPL